jgi:hypothetical protein
VPAIETVAPPSWPRATIARNRTPEGDRDDVAQAAVVGRQAHPDHRREADDRDRLPPLEHPVELVQGRAAHRDHEHRPRRAADVDERDGEHDRRDRDDDPREQVGALALLRRRSP